MIDDDPAAPLLDDERRILDAPFTHPDDWFPALRPGTCAACGGDAERGVFRWWHLDSRVCPKLDGRRWHAEPPTFVAA